MNRENRNRHEDVRALVSESPVTSASSRYGTGFKYFIVVILHNLFLSPSKNGVCLAVFPESPSHGKFTVSSASFLMTNVFLRKFSKMDR